MLLKDIKREFNQIVIVKTKTLFLLIQISVEKDLIPVLCRKILFTQAVQR